MLPRSAHSQTSPVAEQFARKVTATRTVWTVSGEQGLARIPSANRPGRDVTLCWSSPEAAERHGRRMARNSRINPIGLGDFAAEVLPKLRALNRLVAPDWTADPFDPQVEAGQLENWLKAEGTAHFAGNALRRRTVYILEDDIGPAFAASVQAPGKLVLPVWTDPESAAEQIKGFWAEMAVSDLSLSMFTGKLLPQVAGMARGVSLDPCLGGMVCEIGAMELSARLTRGVAVRKIA